MVAPIQMSNNKIVGLADATAPSDGVNKKILDSTVNSLVNDLGAEHRRYADTRHI